MAQEYNIGNVAETIETAKDNDENPISALMKEHGMSALDAGGAVHAYNNARIGDEE